MHHAGIEHIAKETSAQRIRPTKDLFRIIYITVIQREVYQRSRSFVSSLSENPGSTIFNVPHRLRARLS